MAGWRVAFMSATREVVAALAKLKSYLDYGTFQPIQIAATVTLNEAPDYPKLVRDDLPGAVATRCATAWHRIGWDIEPAPRHHVRVGADPRALPRAGFGRVRVDAW